MNARARFALGGSILAGLGLAVALSCCATSGAPPNSAPPAPVVSIAPVSTADPASSAAVSAGPTCTEPAGAHPAVLNVEDPATWPARNQISSAADSSSAVEKACKQIAARRAKAVKKSPGGDDPALQDVGRCFPSPRGAWALDVTRAGALAPDQTYHSGGWEVAYEVVYVTPQGKLARSPEATGEVSYRDEIQRTVDILADFDYDGDGASEVVLLKSEHAYGEEHSYDYSMLTFTGGSVVEYGPAAKLAIEGVVDVDGDKRPDILIGGPFAVSGPCGLDGQTFRGPTQIAHSLADGTFSIDDAVAKEVVRLECGAAPRELVAVSHSKDGTWLDPEATARRITCARIYGVAPDAASRGVRERYPFPHKADDSEPEDPSAPGYCLPLKSLVELAQQKPDFTTTAPCAPK